MIPSVTAGLAGAIVLGFVAVAGLAVRHREQPGAVPFVALTLLLAAMTVGAALTRFDVVGDDSAWAVVVFFGPYTFASLAWLVLAFEYTGRGPVMTRRRIGALAAFGVAVLATTALVTVVPESIRPVWVFLINVVQTTLIALAGYGAFLVARSAITYDDLPLSGSLVLTTAGGGILAITVAMVLVPLVVSPEVAFDVVLALLGGVAGLLLLAQVRYRVFETGASAGHLAREAVLDEMDAAVAITDRDDRVLDCNRAAERTFGVDAPEAVGTPIEAVVGADPAPTGGRPRPIETDEGRRQFEIERPTLTGRGDDPIGRAYLLRDVTERRTDEQRLDVLNRVLRHNLRNDLDAIRGFAEALERGGDDPETLAERIHDTAADLADLGSDLERAERLLAREAVDYEAVDLVDLVRGVAADVEAAHEGSVAVAAPEAPIEVRTDPTILATVVEETLANALEHGGDDPRAEVSVEPWGRGATVEVADEGPGIPERERAVLLEGEETPLRHGSGVGLWLIYWGVTRLGGDLAFRENDPRGSVVSLRIPDR